jgi:hypothetical protein
MGFQSRMVGHVWKSGPFRAAFVCVEIYAALKRPLFHALRSGGRGAKAGRMADGRGRPSLHRDMWERKQLRSG